MKDVVGFQSGSLTVIRGQYHKMTSHGNRLYVESQCKCGAIVEHVWDVIVAGKTTGCKKCVYCKRREHGMTKTNAYKRFQSMLKRCNNVNEKCYKNYGGRGIKVLWNTFEDFYYDMGECPGKGYSIDRIDNDGHYCKENCRWATKKEQNSNRRDTVLIKHNGETKNILERGKEYNIKPKTIYSRINKYGWDPIRAITTKI